MNCRVIARCYVLDFAGTSDFARKRATEVTVDQLHSTRRFNAWREPGITEGYPYAASLVFFYHVHVQSTIGSISNHLH
jgi:hypothetical protein